jgi:PAS domain S-box-containing protein
LNNNGTVKLFSPDRHSFSKDVLKIVGLALVYFLAHRIAFFFPDSEKVIMLVWPAGGIGLAAFLLNPRRLWPALTIAFYISGIAADILLGSRSFMTGVGYMTGNIVESIGCASLILYWAGDFRKFTRIKEILALIVGTVFINAFSSCIGAGTSVLTRGTSFIESWQSWYISDGLGILMVGPFIVTWIGVKEAIVGLRFKKMIEGAAFIAIWSLLTLLIFRTYEINDQLIFHPYLLLGPLVWAALRLGQRGVTLALMLLFAIAIFSPAIVSGPSPWTGPEQSLGRRLLDLQEFLGFGAIVGYLLAAGRADRNRAEEELLWKTALLESQVEANLDGLLIVDSNNQKILTNKRLFELLKVPQHIMEDKDDTSLLQYVLSQTKYPDKFLEKVKYLYSHKGETSQDEIEFKNGMVFDRYSSPVVDKNGKYFGRIWTFRDITERKLAEQALQESEKRYHTLFENSLEGIGLAKGNQVIDANPALLKIFGYENLEEFIKIPLLDHVAPESRSLILDKRKEFQRNDPAKNTFEYKIIRKDGELRNLEISTGYVQLGNDTYTQSTFRDITERKRAEEALRETREQVQAIIDNTPSLVYIKDIEGRLQLVNRKFEAVFGLPGRKLVGKTSHDIIMSKEVADAHRAADLEVMAKRAGVSVEEVNDEPDGRHTYLSTKFPLFDAAGKIYGVCGISTDITEHKRAEQALRESEERLRLALKATNDVVWDWDVINNTQKWNESGTIAFGWTDIVERPQSAHWWVERVHPEDMQRVSDGFFAVVNNPEADYWHDEYRFRKADGSYAQVMDRGYVLRDKQGKAFRMIGAMLDITDRKLAEQALRESEIKFRAMFENSRDAINVSKNGVQIFANSAFLKLYGYQSNEEIAGTSVVDHVAPGHRQQILQNINRRAAGESVPGFYETRGLKTDGTEFDEEINISTYELNGETYSIAVIRDITERKQAEQKILEYQKRLKKLAIQLTLVEEQERRRIAGQLHDEVSQTLAMAKIKLDTLRNSLQSEASAAVIKEISSSVEEVILETRMLTFELSNPILYEVGFEAAVEDWLNDNIREKHGIATEFYDDGLPKPLNENLKTMLFRNVRELLNNCIKHAKAGKIMVGLRRINDSIEVTVEDNGVGFDPAQVRTKTGKKATYGLFSIRENIENAGGYFEIESKSGAGCKTIMTVPLKDQSNKKEA